MTRIRLNNEYRQKFFNRIKQVFEEEPTQEKEGYLQARENVNEAYSKVFPLAKKVVERTNLPEDVKVLQGFKEKYGSPCDVVAKDKDAYKYLSESIDLFPTQDELTKILISSGFENIKSINLFNGIVAIHTGYKI